MEEMKQTYVAPAIQCDGCANSIKRSLGKLTGVLDVSVDIASKRVEVDFDVEKVDENAILTRLEQAGYPAQKA
jgi:Cu+-exporting ATPase